jgi:hypothetical protein
LLILWKLSCGAKLPGGLIVTEPMIQRETLPIPDPAHVGLTTFDAKDPKTVYSPILPLRPPAGAPNVLIVLVDDVGFGASSAFGGPCRTPTAERAFAAHEGLEIGRDLGSPSSPDYGPRGGTPLVRVGRAVFPRLDVASLSVAPRPPRDSGESHRVLE